MDPILIVFGRIKDISRTMTHDGSIEEGSPGNILE